MYFAAINNAEVINVVLDKLKDPDHALQEASEYALDKLANQDGQDV